MLCVDGSTMMEVGRYSSYIEPYHGYEYDDAALQYTGITFQKLQQEGVPLKVVVDKMVEEVKKWHKATTETHTKKPILVGHNPEFDIVFLQQIFKETKNDLRCFHGYDDFYGHYQPTIIDTINISKWAYGADETMVNFKLGTCVSKVGLSLPDAHKAMNDVVGTKELFIKYVNRLRTDISLLDEDQQQKIRFRENLS